MLLELLAAGALILNIDECNLQAEVIASCDQFEVKTMTPELGAALERVAKRRGYWSPNAFYGWADKWMWDCNVSYVRENYWLIDTLPPLSELEGFPSLDYINKQYEMGTKYYSFLVKLTNVASPWELDNVQFLKEETQKCLEPWALAWQIRTADANKNPLQTRKNILTLQAELKGPISQIWDMPALPYWHFR